MKVLITGAFGMIGRELIKELEEAHELLLFDRMSPEDATVFVPGEHERAKAPFTTSWPCLKGEVTDPQAVQQAVEGVDAVIHLAAGVTGLPEYGLETFHTNACGTYNLLDACRLAGVKRFLCASSINAFGTFAWRLSGKPVVYDKMPLTEEFEPVPEDAYSLSKLFKEFTCAAFTRAFGTTTAAFRFAGVFGNDLYEEIRSNIQPTEEWSDDLYQWVHVSDIATGLRQALEVPELPEFGVYTLGAGDTRCPEPTMEVLKRFRPDLAETLKRPLEGREPLLSIEKAQRTFGYAPRFRLGD